MVVKKHVPVGRVVRYFPIIGIVDVVVLSWGCPWPSPHIFGWPGRLVGGDHFSFGHRLNQRCEALFRATKPAFVVQDGERFPYRLLPRLSGGVGEGGGDHSFRIGKEFIGARTAIFGVSPKEEPPGSLSRLRERPFR